MARTAELVDAVAKVRGARVAFAGSPRFHEAVIQLDRPAGAVLEQLAARKIAGGYDLSADYPELGSALLVCATETKTSADVAAYAAALEAAVHAVKAA
jgi:glycine dehydrogenase subunit 1